MLKTILVMTLLSCVSGCVSAVNSNAICDGTSSARTKHAAALARDGGDASVVTGANLIMMIDAACLN
jgi:hypothetical protein